MLGVQAVLKAQGASLDVHEWPGTLSCDSTHGSGLTSKGSKCSVAKDGAHPDPRNTQAVLCEQHIASVTLCGSGHPAKSPLLYKAKAHDARVEGAHLAPAGHFRLG